MKTLTSPPTGSPVVTLTSEKVGQEKNWKAMNNPQWMTWLVNLFNAQTETGLAEMTVSGAVGAGIKSLELNHATVVIAATIANSKNHAGLFIVKDTSASGTAAHTCTLTAGTWDGTNTVATLNAPGEALIVYFDSKGDGVIVENIGAVALS